MAEAGYEDVPAWVEARAASMESGARWKRDGTSGSADVLWLRIRRRKCGGRDCVRSSEWNCVIVGLDKASNGRSNYVIIVGLEDLQNGRCIYVVIVGLEPVWRGRWE